MTDTLSLDGFPHVWEFCEKVVCCHYCGKKPNRLNYDGECDKHEKEKAR